MDANKLLVVTPRWLASLRKTPQPALLFAFSCLLGCLVFACSRGGPPNLGTTKFLDYKRSIGGIILGKSTAEFRILGFNDDSLLESVSTGLYSEVYTNPSFSSQCGPFVLTNISLSFARHMLVKIDGDLVGEDVMQRMIPYLQTLFGDHNYSEERVRVRQIDLGNGEADPAPEYTTDNVTCDAWRGKKVQLTLTGDQGVELTDFVFLDGASAAHQAEQDAAFQEKIRKEHDDYLKNKDSF